MCFVSAPLARARNNSSKSFRELLSSAVSGGTAARFLDPRSRETTLASKLFNSICAGAPAAAARLIAADPPSLRRSLFRLFLRSSPAGHIELVQPTGDTAAPPVSERRCVYQLRHVPGTDTHSHARTHARGTALDFGGPTTSPRTPSFYPVRSA